MVGKFHKHRIYVDCFGRGWLGGATTSYHTHKSPLKKHLSNHPLKKLPQNLNEQIKGVGKLKQHKSNIGDMLTHLTSNIDFKNPHLT
jgi:hypothetical protein